MRKLGMLWENGGSTVLPYVEKDKNEQFILKKCAEYFLRHFDRYPVLERESFEMLSWILGSQKKGVAECLLDQLKGLDARKDFENELLECGQDCNDYGRVLFRILVHIRKHNKNQIFRKIKRLVEKQAEINQCDGKSEIEENLSTIQAMFKLTDYEIRFCAWLFILTTYEPAEDYFVNHLGCNKFLGKKYLINILNMSQQQLNAILAGVLQRIEMFEMDSYNFSLANNFLKLFQGPTTSDFSKKFFSGISKNNISLRDYFLKKEQTEHILKLFKTKPKTGTHILLYGAPGTGKTSFATGLATKLDIPSYSIIQGEENTTMNRRAAIMACLNMTNIGEGSLVVVDEADNLLNTVASWFMRGETQDKGWLNHLLEEPEVRMIWITNRIQDIDESVLRRFAFSLHFKPFNKRQRIQLWHNIAKQNRIEKFLGDSDIEKLARKFKVSAGIIDLAVKKAIEANSNSKAGFHQAIALALEAHLTLMNSGNEPKVNEGVKDDYTLKGLNIEGDVNLVLRAT